MEVEDESTEGGQADVSSSYIDEKSIQVLKI